MANRINEKNLIRSQAEYNAAIDAFGGVDLTSPDGRCEAGHFPYLVNMYRDWENEDGTALETIPGYRELPKTMGREGEKIYGVFSHTFTVNGEEKAYLLIHKGKGLYLFCHGERDTSETLTSVITLAESPSCGYSRRGAFYLLDGEHFVCLSSPNTAVYLGDEAYTDEMADAGQFPATTAYIPTVYKNGKEYEDRNLLSDYYDIEECPENLEEIGGQYGLKLRLFAEEEGESLEVYGLESGRQAVYVPDTALYNGKILPITRIAPGAFAGRNITLAVLSESVKVIGGGSEGTGEGAFYGCSALKRVLLGGVTTLEADAFALCSSLETLILPAALKTVASSAFYGTTSLRTVYYEGTSFPDNLAVFSSDVTVYSSVLLYRAEVGKNFYLSCNTAAYPKLYRTMGDGEGVFGTFEAYDGVYEEKTGRSDGFVAKAKAPAALVGYQLRSMVASESDRYVFITVTDSQGRVFSPEEEPLSLYELPIPDCARAVVSVMLDETVLPYSNLQTDSRLHYAVRTGERQGKNAVTALHLTLPSEEVRGKTIRVRLYGHSGVYGSYSLPDYRLFNPTYTKSSLEAIRACRKAALYDGRVFLSGNPSLPGTVFYSLTPKDNRLSGVYFGAHAFVQCGEGCAPVSSLLSHPAYLAVMKQESTAGGGLFFCTPQKADGLLDVRYTVVNGSAAVGCAGASLNFRDDPVFLSRIGLCGLGKGALSEEKTVENRSFSVDRRLLSKDLSEASLTEWKGYLVLLCGGEIFLADSRTTYNKNGSLQYEWYWLCDIGRYRGQARVYHHLSAWPVVDGVKLSALFVGGQPLRIRKDETRVMGEVLRATAHDQNGTDSKITVYYTDEVSPDGSLIRYLVDSDGEMQGGEFVPACTVYAFGDVLYFGTEDGHLFCFNTDKRGEAALVGGRLFPVEKGEIHNQWYTFNGRAYLSGFATPYEDHGLPHLAKSTVRRSLVVRSKAMPYSAFTVCVRTEKEGWKESDTLTASTAFDEKDFTNESFSPATRPLHLLREHEKKWVEKQLSFYSKAYRRPFGIYAIAYRYRMAGRPKP